MRVLGFAVLVAFCSVAGSTLAADTEAGKRIFQTVCHRCHAALPYTGRIGL